MGSNSDKTGDRKMNETSSRASINESRALDAPELLVPKNTNRADSQSNGDDLEKDLGTVIAALSENDRCLLIYEALDPAAELKFSAISAMEEENVSDVHDSEPELNISDCLNDPNTPGDLKKIARQIAGGDRNINSASVANSVWIALYDRAAKIANRFKTRDDFINYCRKSVYHSLCKRWKRKEPTFSDVEPYPRDDEKTNIDPAERPHNDKEPVFVDLLKINSPNEIDDDHGNFQDSKWARLFYTNWNFLNRTYKDIADEYGTLGYGVVSAEKVAEICKEFRIEILKSFAEQTQSNIVPQDWTIFSLRDIRQMSPERIARERHYPLETVNEAIARIKEINEEYELSLSYGDAIDKGEIQDRVRRLAEYLKYGGDKDASDSKGPQNSDKTTD